MQPGGDYVKEHVGTIALCVIVLLLVYDKYYRNRKKYRLPPGPPRLPLVGSLPFLGKDFREPLRKMAQKYGEMTTIYIGSRQTVYLNTYDVIKEAFVKNGNLFAGRPQDFFYLKELCGNIGIIASEGGLWKEQRRFTHTVLKDLGVGRIQIEPVIQEEIQFYLAVLDETVGTPIDPRLVTMKAICNVLYTIVNGNRNDYADRDFSRHMRDMNRSAKAIRASGPIVAFPYLRYLPGDMFSLCVLQEDRAHNTSVFLNVVQRHHETLDPENPRDFIDVYLLRMMEDQKLNPDSSTFSYGQLLQVIQDMYGAGTDTSTNTVMWCLIYLLHYPDVMKRCQAEIDDVIGRHKAPSMRNKPSMPYMEATIYEVSRMASVVPFAVPHTATEDIKFKGYHFPKGTNFMPNIYAVHMDPVTWPEPEVFTPSRHLTEEGKLAKKEQFIPFSIGRRVCIGESLARMSLFLFLTSVLQKYDLFLPEGEPLPPLQGELGAVNHAPPVNLIFKHR